MQPHQLADGLWVVTAGTFPSNTYICESGSNEAVLIDAGLNAAAIENSLVALALRPTRILCTHGHFDHIGSAKYFQGQYGTPTCVHRADGKTAKSSNFLLMATKRDERIDLPEIEFVDDDFAFNCDRGRFQYRHTPGHTPGSCVISFGDHLFTGDTIYSRGVGLSKLPGERHDQLRDSIMSIWDGLESYLIHPGHGPSAAGVDVKAGNERLRAFLGLSPAPRNPVWDGSDVKGAV